MVSGRRGGLVFLRDGKLTYAEVEELRGLISLLEIVTWEYVDFAYDSSLRPAAETILGPWDKVLIETINSRKRPTNAPVPATTSRSTRRWWS